jgi:hypothetical protein
MVVEDAFYLLDGRMVFSGQFINNSDLRLPIDVAIFVNDVVVGKIQLTTLPFLSGKNVKKDIDVIEASTQVDLKFVKWDQDKVILKSY